MNNSTYNYKLAST